MILFVTSSSAGGDYLCLIGACKDGVTGFREPIFHFYQRYGYKDIKLCVTYIILSVASTYGAFSIVGIFYS